LDAFDTTGACADKLKLILMLLGANGASIATAVASPNNTLFVNFINGHF